MTYMLPFRVGGEDPADERSQTMKCPGCNGQGKPVAGTVDIHECRDCGGIFGHCYLGQSYEYVKPWFAKEPVAPEKLRYFDFTCTGSEGQTRRHGWYDPETKLIHQTG